MTDRRTFLTAALAAPVAIAAPAAAQTFICAPSPFDAALAEYHQARAKVDVANTAPSFDDDDMAVFCRATDKALERLVSTPAEQGQHIREKIEAVLAEYLDCQIDYSLIERIARDARRLLA